MRRTETPVMPATLDEGSRTGVSARLEDRGPDRAVLARGRVAPAVSRTMPLPEESVIVDDRTELSPAQAVENKLMALLKETPLPVSQLQARGLLRGRSMG